MSVLGIDLGTTNTVVACVRSGRVHVLADERGSRLLPSVVSFHPNGQVLVGAAAKARRVIDPQNTIYSHKRLIGRAWGSPEIAQAASRFAFQLREGPGQGPLVDTRGKQYTLPEISALVLKRARQIAEGAIGEGITQAVITVPAHFNELQRASTKVAGRVSGIEVLRILNEPTAAALAYGLGRAGHERVAVYDFGGGTFDCTLLDLNGNVFEVLATAGDSFLGGDDVDTLIAERMAESYLRAHRYDPRTNPQMFERLKSVAEELKVALSSAETHTVVLRELGYGAGGSSIHFTFTLSRRELEAIVAPIVDRTISVTEDALSLARLAPTSFDRVILVGGSTRIPLVRRRVEALFGTPPMDRVNPDEVVAIGAAIQAAALTERRQGQPIPPAPPVMAGAPPTEREEAPRKITKPGVAPAHGVAGSDETSITTESFVPGTLPDAPPAAVGEPEPFGHVSDLSLVTNAPDVRAIDDLDDVLATRPLRRTDDAGGRRGRMPPPPPAPPPPASQTIAMPNRPRLPSTPSAPRLPARPLDQTLPLAQRPPAPAEAPPPPAVRPPTQPPFAPFASAPPAGFAPHAPGFVAPVLVDVTPRALVVETAGAFTDTVVPRNSRVPCERTRRFATARDGQTVVRIRVAQGERPLFGGNTYLGEVELSGLRPAPRGEVLVAVTFELDADGTLRVRARDDASGSEARATLQLVGVADDSSIAAMADRVAQAPVVGPGGSLFPR